MYTPFKSFGKVILGKGSFKDFAIAIPEVLLISALSGFGIAFVRNLCAEAKPVPVKQAAPEQPKPKKPFSFEEYGAIVYQKNQDLQNQLYVIAQSHRSPIDNQYTIKEAPRVQTEIYRIAEHLIKEKNIELLLDEGLDAEEENSDLHRFIAINMLKLKYDSSVKKISEDDSVLEDILADKELPTDAAYLLNAAYPIIVQGADNKKLLNDIDNLIKYFLKGYGTKEEMESVLDHLCEARSALILQNSPFVIEREINAGRIKNRKAIIIIGSLHIDEMQRFVENDRITISPVEKYGLPFVDKELCLTKRNYGITIINPLSIK